MYFANSSTQNDLTIGSLRLSTTLVRYSLLESILLIPNNVESGYSSKARIYKFPNLNSSRTVTLDLVAEFGNSDNQITGADISWDGKRLALISDLGNIVWVIERSSDSIKIEDFVSNPSKIWIANFDNQKGEAIGFVHNSYDLIIASEQGTVWSLPQSVYEH